jgi:drug/metabolite transporter (DMT)-like permease
LKTFASALELMFTAVFCWLLFGIPIHLTTIVAIAIVSYSVFLYSQNPVVNQTPTSTSAQSPLLKETEEV